MRCLLSILAVVTMAGCAASAGGPLPAPTPAAVAVVEGSPPPCVTAAPAMAFGPDGLPLPGAIALGLRLADLPLKQDRSLLGDGASLLANHLQVLEAGGFRLRLALADQDRVVAAQVTSPDGLDDAAAAAWLQAIVPCAAKAYVPPRRQAVQRVWLRTAGLPTFGAKLGDEVQLEAVPDAQDASWLKGRLDELGGYAPDVTVPASRWQAVGAFWITYGK